MEAQRTFEKCFSGRSGGAAKKGESGSHNNGVCWITKRGKRLACLSNANGGRVGSATTKNLGRNRERKRKGPRGTDMHPPRREKKRQKYQG